MRLPLLNVVLAAVMVGVLWLVQLVVYPMFLDAGPRAFPAWETEHSRRITWVVGPAIVGQVLVAAALVRTAPGWLARVNLGLVVLVCALTALVSVPLHDQLAQGFDPGTIDDLVQTNWLRTAGWTVQLAVAAALLWRRVPAAQ